MYNEPNNSEDACLRQCQHARFRNFARLRQPGRKIDRDVQVSLNILQKQPVSISHEQALPAIAIPRCRALSELQQANGNVSREMTRVYACTRCFSSVCVFSPPEQ